MKFVVLIIDGAAGWPVDSLGGKTSLEAACTPNLDQLAREGAVGLVHTIPAGMEPSSAIACMSLLGFDPVRYYSGRGPIEATAMGIRLAPGEAALRCNLVNVTDGLMRSYAAGHIPSAESHQLIRALQSGLGNDKVSFHPGVGFRHVLTVKNAPGLADTQCTPPHDISDRLVADYLPRGPEAGFLLELMERSKPILAAHPVNRERRARGDLPATQIWLFWPGLRPRAMPSFARVHGRSAMLTSAVDLLVGLARLLAMNTLHLPGVTAFGDNDYAGQMAGALAVLRADEVAVVHVEAPDEAGHCGDVQGKVKAIEQVDSLMVPLVMELARREPGMVRLLVLPDHPTPLAIKTHVAEPVPFLIWGPGFPSNGARCYTEAAARETGLVVSPGHTLMAKFVK